MTRLAVVLALCGSSLPWAVTVDSPESRVESREPFAFPPWGFVAMLLESRVASAHSGMSVRTRPERATGDVGRSTWDFLAGQSDEKPVYPPFTVVVTAKTGKLVPGDLAPLINAIKRMQGYAVQKSREKVVGDPDWHEEWTFEIPGDKKFDPNLFRDAFIRFNPRRFHLTMTGTLSQEAQTKKLFITSFTGKSKVKLMNRPKSDFDKSERKAEDNVGQMTKLFEEGKLHFTVSGDIFSHGGTLAILLETYTEAGPPPEKPKEEKK